MIGTLWKHIMQEVTSAHGNHVCTTAFAEL